MSLMYPKSYKQVSQRIKDICKSIISDVGSLYWNVWKIRSLVNTLYKLDLIDNGDIDSSEVHELYEEFVDYARIIAKSRKKPRKERKKK